MAKQDKKRLLLKLAEGTAFLAVGAVFALSPGKAEAVTSQPPQQQQTIQMRRDTIRAKLHQQDNQKNLSSRQQSTPTTVLAQWNNWRNY